ncbi:MAG: hypothetical protein R2699_03200 [Acidimicrobiales bacterium]
MRSPRPRSTEGVDGSGRSDAAAGGRAIHPVGDGPLWGESWYFDFHDAAGTVGGYVRIGQYPNLGVTWYWACLVGADRPPHRHRPHHPDAGRDRSSLELRSEGLWADHNLEEPWQRWSPGLEAFALAVDDPAEAYAETTGGARACARRSPSTWSGRRTGRSSPIRRASTATIRAAPTASLDVGTERLEIDGFGQRDHSWGGRDWWSWGWLWSAFRLDDGQRYHAVSILPSAMWSMGYHQPAGDGAPVEQLARSRSCLPTPTWWPRRS